jgi:hypothetical protein
MTGAFVPKPLAGTNLRVFTRLLDLTEGKHADVQFADLVKSYPGAEPTPSAAEVQAALMFLKTERYVCTLTVFGVGGSGLPLLEERQAEEAARLAELEAAQQTETGAGAPT